MNKLYSKEELNSMTNNELKELLNSVNSKIDFARIICSLKDDHTLFKENKFWKIMAFSFKNISGFIQHFNFNNKSFLTVGSSADQSISSAMYNCFDQTIYDICPFAEEYFYLKKAALLTLSYHEFLYFFGYYHSPNDLSPNPLVFDELFFKSLENNLKFLDYEGFLMWIELFKEFGASNIRRKLFNSKELHFEVIKKCIPYLQNEEQYLKARTNISMLNPKFEIGSIYENELIKTYDNINLSDIAAFNCPQSHRNLIIDLEKKLNLEGIIILDYIYKVGYLEHLNKRQTEIKDFISDIKTFDGIEGMIFEDYPTKDMVLIHKK